MFDLRFEIRLLDLLVEFDPFGLKLLESVFDLFLIKLFFYNQILPGTDKRTETRSRKVTCEL